jgi:hypothetical protein
MMHCAIEPAVAGKLSADSDRLVFNYAGSYVLQPTQRWPRSSTRLRASKRPTPETRHCPVTPPLTLLLGA